jgi:beta-glucosidase
MTPSVDRNATMTVDGVQFRDLDHDGVLAPYEDWRLPVAERVEDLLGRMTLADKVGAMLHGTATANGPMGMSGRGDAYDLDDVRQMIGQFGINSMISRLSRPPRILAEQNNLLQSVAAATRLGIPVTISTDPRNHFDAIHGAGVEANGFSQWPGTLGLGAIGDVELARRFGDIVRQEYRAVGFTMALSPQADLATEPRWPRSDGTFGSDPARVGPLVAAVIEGMQGGPRGLAATGVAAVVKHWVGYGASRDGFDGHNYYGRYSAFPDGRFQDHVDAFLPSFACGVAGVMPTYNILEDVSVDGSPLEQVGAGFNAQLLQLLRETYGFGGLIVSDWGIAKDANDACRTGVPIQMPIDIAMPWGVEDLTRVQRYAKGIAAGLDQFGGESDPSYLLAAVDQGLVSEERIDASVRRILRMKFDLGLFEQPFVDVDAAADIVGSAVFAAEALAAQRRSITVLEAASQGPIRADDVVLVHGMAPDAFTAAGIATTTDLAVATVAVLRLGTPHQVLHPGHFFGRMQHEGDLDFKPADPALVTLVELGAKVATIVVINLDRAAVLTNIVEHSSALLVEYGLYDEALVDVLLGHATPEGRLPIALPADMESVNRGDGAFTQLYPIGAGRYSGAR